MRKKAVRRHRNVTARRGRKEKEGQKADAT
jgi:hypothetical protein